MLQSASREGNGARLMQEKSEGRKPATFELAYLNTLEHKWSTFELELLAFLQLMES